MLKSRRLIILENQEKDEWSGFADLLASLIEKYASVLDIDSLPDMRIEKDAINCTDVDHYELAIEKRKHI